MVERYTLPEMGQIWTEQSKYNTWLEVEILAVEAMAELGILSKDIAKNIRDKAKCDADRILEIEQITKHDIIAFLTNVEEHVGEDELRNMFSYQKVFQSVDFIFARLGI